jgi:hypothetical protein
MGVCPDVLFSFCLYMERKVEAVYYYTHYFLSKKKVSIIWPIRKEGEDAVLTLVVVVDDDDDDDDDECWMITTTYDFDPALHFFYILT